MKFLVLLLVLVVAWLIWRHGRLTQRNEQGRPGAKAAPGVQLEMVRCTVCGVHLPRADATEGTAGRLYCGADHRRQGEG